MKDDPDYLEASSVRFGDGKAWVHRLRSGRFAVYNNWRELQFITSPDQLLEKVTQTCETSFPSPYIQKDSKRMSLPLDLDLDL